MTATEFAAIAFRMLDQAAMLMKDQRAIDWTYVGQAPFQSSAQVALQQRVDTWDKALDILGTYVGEIRSLASEEGL